MEMQGLVFAAPRVDEINMARDHSHGNHHVNGKPTDDSAHATTAVDPNMKPDDGTMV